MSSLLAAGGPAIHLNACYCGCVAAAETVDDAAAVGVAVAGDDVMVAAAAAEGEHDAGDCDDCSCPFDYMWIETTGNREMRMMWWMAKGLALGAGQLAQMTMSVRPTDFATTNFQYWEKNRMLET